MLHAQQQIYPAAVFFASLTGVHLTFILFPTGLEPRVLAATTSSTAQQRDQRHFSLMDSWIGTRMITAAQIKHGQPVHAGSCSMWEIYDEYCKDFERQRQEEASKAKPGSKKPAAAAAAGSTPGTAAAGGTSRSSVNGVEQWARTPGVLDGLRVLDRMVNQNTFSDIIMDFKYWEDTSDQFK